MSSGKIWRRPAVLLALCLVSVGGVVTLLGRLATGPAVALKRVELSSEIGAKAYPAFAPDGQRLAYSARGTSSKDETYHVFIRDVTVGPAQQLTTGPANDISPVWSPDGAKIAFVRLAEGEGECVVIPASGGGEVSPSTPMAERKFPGCTAPGDETQPSPSVSWMRDGQSLVVVQTSDRQSAALAILSLADGKFRPLTHPPAGAEDSTPAVAPDGNSIAFVRTAGNDNANIFVSDAAGANPPHALTFDGRSIRGIAWSRDGQDLIYTGQRVGMSRLWRVPAYGGSPRDLIIAGRDAQFAAVAPLGNRLVYTVSPTVSSVWRAELGSHDHVVEHAILRSAGRENGARYSPDGKTIANISDQTGNDEIWLSDAEGGNRVQVTSFKGPDLARIRWSPDGKSLIFDASSEQGNDLYTVPATAGAKPVRVQIGAMNGSWSHNGKSLYFQARNQIWKSAANGGEPQQIQTSEGAAQPVESVDGKYIYFRNNRAFYRVPIGGGEEERAIVPEHDLMWSTTLQPTKQGMYYIEYARSAGDTVVSFFDYAEKKSSVVFQIKHSGWRDGATYSISPDGKYILYARVDQSQTNIEVVENFR
jgi:Tol biopolymer transport system component